jgi:thiamine-monophosphate kinase
MPGHGEFDIIRHFFTRNVGDSSVHLGIGDDAALLAVPAGYELVVTTDTLVSGHHFPIETSPFDIGWKSLAVNLSDLAAMGAEARWITLAITLPTNNEDFLRDFSHGFFALAQQEQVTLVGGDTTKGPLSITVTAMGVVPQGQALRRSSAKVGDGIYVSGAIGDAGLGLRLALQQWPDEMQEAHADFVRQRLNRPEPRLTLGQQLRGIANACMDISDGLAQDLSHLLIASQVGAVLELSALPRSPVLKTVEPSFADVLALTSGDDYELLFTVPPERQYLLPDTVYRIGQITDSGRLQLVRDRQPIEMPIVGFQHF